MATGRARAFWMARERRQENGGGEEAAPAVNGGSACYATLGRVNGCERPAPWDAQAWAGLYCTLRDKRRGRSRTPGSTATAVVATHRPPPRSLTPNSLTSSSGRTTPTLSPSHGPLFRMASRTTSEEVLSMCSDSSRASCVSQSSHRFRATCWLEPRPVPVHYSSTVYMNVGSTKKRYVEEVTFQTRLVPRRFSESMTTATTIPSRRFTSVLEIQCLAPAVHVISLDDYQMNGLNGITDEHEA